MTHKILVTGASKGIGLEISKGLSKLGHDVFLTSRDENKLKENAQKIGAKGVFKCDLACDEDLFKLGEFVKKEEIDILINNAGLYIYKNIEQVKYSEISEIFKINSMACIYLTSCVAEVMKKNNWGRIINIGSISGVMGEAYASLYSASKASLIGFTKATALELAQYGITVNTINPGWVETELGMKSIEESEFSLEETLETIPQKRFVKPEEIEKMIEYLISDVAKGVTGQSINICAGLSVGI